MDNFTITLSYTDSNLATKNFKISGLKQNIDEAKALQALRQLPSLGGFVNGTGQSLYVEPIQATVTQTTTAVYKA